MLAEAEAVAMHVLPAAVLWRVLGVALPRGLTTLDNGLETVHAMLFTMKL